MARGARGWRLPIIAVTSSTLEADRQRALAAGMDEHLTKPVDINQLRMLVRSAVRESGAPVEPAVAAIVTSEASALGSAPSAAGWEVLVEQDREVVRRSQYSDWHRVERAVGLLEREVKELESQGWRPAAETVSRDR